MSESAKNADALTYSKQGDSVLLLDSGSTVPVHSAYLEPRSSVLADAIALARGSTKAGSRLHVPLPDTPEGEAELLLRAVYAWHPKELLPELNKQELLMLARICHRFAVQELLTWVDQALAAKCGASRPKPGSLNVTFSTGTCLTPENAMTDLQEARRMGMKAFDKECLSFIVLHLKEVAEQEPDADRAAVLAEASRHTRALEWVYRRYDSKILVKDF